MGKVIVVTSGKGGVGKTTTSANIGTGLAELGKKVLLIDADIGLRNLDVIVGMEDRIVYDLIDVTDGSCRLSEALITDKKYENLSLLPAAQTKDKTAVSPEQMAKLCGELKDSYDYVIIDCPAGIEQGFKNAVAGADGAIVVTVPEVSSVRDADRIIGLLEESGIKEPKLILNRVRPEMTKSGDMLNLGDVKEILGIDAIGVIPDEEAVIIASNRGIPVVLNPDSVAGQAYKNIVRRINGEDVPFLDLEKKKKAGLLTRLKRIFA
ncbi:MAG: septum site-determining protein MinD [Clostridiales bacterium]|nr:septum site-determining protein MinD [Clostridiales bacterium]